MSKLDDGSEVKCLEHSTLKVPYELLNKRFRSTQKVLDREAAHVAQAGLDIEKLLVKSHISPGGLSASSSVEGIFRAEDGGDDGGDRSASASSNPEAKSAEITPKPELGDGENNQKGRAVNGREVSKLLGVIVDRLQTLKRKADESIAEELEAAEMVRKRVIHLRDFDGANHDEDGKDVFKGKFDRHAAANEWKKTRLNRMLVDHLLREGMYDTANVLAETLGIKDLTNVEVFSAAKEVEESLKQHETHRMVVWCYENKSKLRKIQSTLELELRVQEFVELVRKGKRLEAVKHARKYLAESQDPTHMAAVKKCMGLLAFPIPSLGSKRTRGVGSPIHPYYDLLCEERWKELIIHFRTDHARIYQLSPTSVLGTVVQAGLASLKTPNCYRSQNKNPNCPVCSEPLSTLASVLPYAHSAHSQLVCVISGEPLNENNPPMVLPSGYVYGTKSLKEMARMNGGKVVCPRSGQVFSHSEAERVFVM